MTTSALTFAISVGVLLIALGLVAILLFSTQIFVPAQPATQGYWELRTTPPDQPRWVWHAGQPSQPEHFEMSLPNLPTGLSFIFVGLVVSVGSFFFQRRAGQSGNWNAHAIHG